MMSRCEDLFWHGSISGSVPSNNRITFPYHDIGVDPTSHKCFQVIFKVYEICLQGMNVFISRAINGHALKWLAAQKTDS